MYKNLKSKKLTYNLLKTVRVKLCFFKEYLRL